MPLSPVRTLELPSGRAVPVLGQGTWRLGENSSRRRDEMAALRLGLDLGMTLIDTAEMYGDGATEEMVGEALAGRRDEVFLVSKVLPRHATARGTVTACEASLRRLRTDRLDLYLLHWPGNVPLEETLKGFEALRSAGKILSWGVSNFDTDDMETLLALPGGREVTTNQVLYNLSRRGIEWDLLPLCREVGVPVMAYSPIEQGRLLRNPALARVAARHGATPAQVALAWVLSRDNVLVIPRTSRVDHVAENRAALDLKLSKADKSDLDEAFPPPGGKVPLEVL